MDNNLKKYRLLGYFIIPFVAALLFKGLSSIPNESTTVISKEDSAFSNSNFSNEEINLVDFNFDVKPILSDKCYACHGPDEKARKANLRLDIEDGFYASLKDSESHFIVNRNNPNESEILKRINSEIGNRLFFTFISRKTKEKRVLKFAKDNEKVLETLGTSIIKDEEMDNRPIWFEVDTKGNLSDISRFSSIVSTQNELIDTIISLKDLSIFIFVTKNGYDFKRKGKNENSGYRK